MYKAFAKTNLHEVLLSEYSNFFTQYDILSGEFARPLKVQEVYLKRYINLFPQRTVL